MLSSALCEDHDSLALALYTSRNPNRQPSNNPTVTMASKLRNLGLRSFQTTSLARLYHSYDHPPPPGPFNAAETSILSSSIPHIPSHGFTHTSLSLGANDAGYIDASINLFPSGAFSLVHYHLYTQRTGLAEHKHILEPASTDAKAMGVGSKVKALTWERLMGNKEIIHLWQEVRAPSSRSPVYELIEISCRH